MMNEPEPGVDRGAGSGLRRVHALRQGLFPPGGWYCFKSFLRNDLRSEVHLGGKVARTLLMRRGVTAGRLSTRSRALAVVSAVRAAW
jgi:hypothetical protein